MISVFLSLAAILLILIISELLWNNNKLNGESGRKFVHITVGTFVAFWPFYMSFYMIQLISLVFIVVVLAARYLNIFKAVHVAERKTWGDVLFAVGIGLAALFTKTDWIFAAAILNMSLADGLAGLVGKRYGKSSNYKVLGHTKSITGSLIFALTSLTILFFANLHGHLGIHFGNLVGIAAAATIVENVGIYGLDNIFVPTLITISLRFFS